MKANWLLFLFLFFGLGVTDAQQTISLLSDTNSPAFKEMETEAKKGNAVAEGILGYYYTHFQVNYVEAVKWYRKAAEQNQGNAQFNLGYCYYCGQGVATDFKEAAKWFRKAAEQNYELGQCYLGHCYYYGQGVSKDYVEAVKWYQKSAEQNDDSAQLQLGACYFNGQGVEKDIIEAFKWTRKSAETGFVDAEYEVGACYFNGLGVPKNYVQAYVWMSLALSQGNANASQYMPLIEGKLSPEQINEAQQLAAAFVPHGSIVEPHPNSTTGNNLPTASGTGFFITVDGYLISNYHVVKGAAKVRLLTGAGLIDATVVKVDAANDLALLKVTGKFAPLPIAASRTVKLGATVATVGFPDTGLQGFSPKLAKGEIGSLAGIQDDPRYFQISVPVQHGNSGGALVDVRGNVVGIVAAKLSAKAALDATGSLPENVNYAVKSSLLLSFLESVPDVASKIKEPNTKDEPFEDVVKSAQDAAVLVLVY